MKLLATLKETHQLELFDKGPHIVSLINSIDRRAPEGEIREVAFNKSFSVLRHFAGKGWQLRCIALFPRREHLEKFHGSVGELDWTNHLSIRNAVAHIVYAENKREKKTVVLETQNNLSHVGEKHSRWARNYEAFFSPKMEHIQPASETDFEAHHMFVDHALKVVFWNKYHRNYANAATVLYVAAFFQALENGHELHVLTRHSLSSIFPLVHGETAAIFYEAIPKRAMQALEMKREKSEVVVNYQGRQIKLKTFRYFKE
ncbi:hypothetical protein HY991_05405 [Candidatus Micrarchaeota archaeon]|nr:hypothetical protein [Candidatus Micrarchaeota archaeon]